MANSRGRLFPIAYGCCDRSYRAPLFTIVSASLLFGCGSQDRLISLSVGERWDYRFRTGNLDETEKLQVVREVPVANGTGWELRSPMGVMRIGYDGDNLVAEQLADAFLVPPLPIGIPVGRKATWQGWITSHAGKKAAKAVISADSGTSKIAGRERPVNQTTVVLKSVGMTTTLKTSYDPKEGIVEQEQASNEKLEFKITRVSGG